MKIESLHIEGFGHFADQPFGPFTQPLTVVLGHNEAGKSTLLAFIRTVLFGFPAQKRADHYPALRGGRHGGRLTLTGDDGLSYTVARIEDARGVSLKITNSAGLQTADEGVLRGLLGNSSRKVFEAVFALGLVDLQDLKRLNESDASAQIYAAGMGAANLPKALKAIEDARAKLFLKGGSNQDAAKLLARLKEVDDQLEVARGDAARFAALSLRQREIEADIQQATGELAKASGALGEVARLQQAWDDWVIAGEAEARIRELPEQPGFPEDAIARLERAEDALREAVQARQEATTRCEGAEHHVAAPIPGEGLLGHRERLDEVRRQRGAFWASVTDLPKRRTELEGKERELLRALADLGPDWSEERAASFDTSIPLRDAVEQWSKRLEASANASREAELARDRANSALNDAAEAAERLRVELEAIALPTADAETVARERAALSLSRVRLGEYQRASDRRANAEAAASQATPAPVNQLPTRQSALPAVVLAAAGLVALVGGVALGGNAVIPGILLGLVLLGTGAAMFASSRRAIAAAPTAGASAAGTYVESLRDQERAALAALQAAAQPLFSRIPSLADLENAAVRLEGIARALGERSAAERLWTGAIAEQRRLAGRAEAAARVSDDAAATLATDRVEWERWLGELGLQASLSPNAVIGLLARLETVRAEIKATNELRHRVKAIEEDIEAYRALVRPLATEHGITGSLAESADIAGAADRLERDFEAVTKAVTRREEARKALEEDRLRLAEFEDRESDARGRLEALLAAGSATDAEQFRRHARSHAERLQAQRELAAAEARLRRLSGPGEQYTAFRAALGETNLATLEQDRERLTREHADALARFGDLKDERGMITTKLDDLASDEHASQLRADKAVLEEELRETAQRWATLTVALTLLQKAQRKYEEERQPDVLRSAQEFFASVTGGRYERLVSPLGSQAITAVAPDGSSKATGQLSRGTEDQLYLALRFGLIREFGARSAHLPVIVDDILVNFDPERAQRTAAAFADLSDTNQVLVFTCHPETVDLFRSADARTQVIQL